MSHSPPPDLAIVPRHVALQFERRQPWRDAAFLHQEIGERMLERLAYIRLAPAALLDAGCGAGTALAGLRARYPDAVYHGLDQSSRALEAGRAAHGARPGGWRRWLGREPARPETRFLAGDLARAPLADETVDLVWSNLALHWHSRPHQVFAEWFRLLRPQGLVMFSTYGPATLQEVRAAVVEAGLATATLPLVDMHDFGDLLLENGFADPVMDQETLTLTYSDAAELLADVRRLGGNPARGRRPGLAGRAFRQRLLDALEAQRGADGQLQLTLEVAYGHAWRASTRRQGQETLIPVSAISRRRDTA
ncbi:MAG: methyltransferase domain-containing protein [Pigmentiphaga sp.]